MGALTVIYDDEHPDKTRTFGEQLAVEMEFRRSLCQSIGDDPEKPFIFAAEE